MEKESELFIEVFGATISRYRLKPYVTPNRKPIESLSRYLWNVSLSEALYPSISFFEVAFRNALHNALSIHWARWRSQEAKETSQGNNDPRWFMDARLMEPGDLMEVHKALERLRRAKKRVDPLPGSMEQTPLEPQRVIAELPFGFYATLYSDRYTTTIFGPTVRNVFPKAPKSEWVKIPSRLQEILTLRNRISHHEPIHNDPQLFKKHDNVVEMLGWIEPQQRNLLQSSGIDRFESVYASGKGWEKYVYPSEYTVLEFAEPQNL